MADANELVETLKKAAIEAMEAKKACKRVLRKSGDYSTAEN